MNEYFKFELVDLDLFNELKKYYNYGYDNRILYFYVELNNFLNESNNYYEEMLKYQQNLPNDFSIIIDIDKVDIYFCSKDDLNMIYIENLMFKFTLDSDYLYKNKNNYYKKINKNKLIEFFVPYYFIEFTNKTYIPPYFKDKFIVRRIKKDGLVEIFYSNNPSISSNFDLIKYYKKAIIKLNK